MFPNDSNACCIFVPSAASHCKFFCLGDPLSLLPQGGNPINPRSFLQPVPRPFLANHSSALLSCWVLGSRLDSRSVTCLLWWGLRIRTSLTVTARWCGVPAMLLSCSKVCPAWVESKVEERGLRMQVQTYGDLWSMVTHVGKRGDGWGIHLTCS